MNGCVGHVYGLRGRGKQLNIWDTITCRTIMICYVHSKAIINAAYLQHPLCLKQKIYLDLYFRCHFLSCHHFGYRSE